MVYKMTMSKWTNRNNNAVKIIKVVFLDDTVYTDSLCLPNFDCRITSGLSSQPKSITGTKPVANNKKIAYVPTINIYLNMPWYQLQKLYQRCYSVLIIKPPSVSIIKRVSRMYFSQRMKIPCCCSKSSFGRKFCKEWVRFEFMIFHFFLSHSNSLEKTWNRVFIKSNFLFFYDWHSSLWNRVDVH